MRIFVGATYLFYSINVYTNKNQEVLNYALEKLYFSTSTNTQFKTLVHVNTDDERNPTRNQQTLKNIGSRFYYVYIL